MLKLFSFCSAYMTDFCFTSKYAVQHFQRFRAYSPGLILTEVRLRVTKRSDNKAIDYAMMQKQENIRFSSFELAFYFNIY